MVRVESDGSCILQELRHAPVNVDFSSENFPLLFAVARVSAYIIQLERFCRMKQVIIRFSESFSGFYRINLKTIVHFYCYFGVTNVFVLINFQELAFENFMNTSVGQMFLFNLQKLISANQMDFVRFFGEVWQDRIFRGEVNFPYCNFISLLKYFCNLNV